MALRYDNSWAAAAAIESLQPDWTMATTSTPDFALRQQFLDGMSLMAATVGVVTTDGHAGRHGVTVSALAPLSADAPRPTLLVCIHELSRASAAIRGNGVFCVNVLRHDQAAISDAFAGRSEASTVDKFSVSRWTSLATGSPRIVDPLVAFDCVLKEALQRGTHNIFIGEVAEIWRAQESAPLIYANRAYAALMRLELQPPEPRSDEANER